MPLLSIIVLAAVQGITEFLPISSQAHDQLVPLFAGWGEPSLTMIVAVHVGTLAAVILYFWRDLWAMLVAVVLQLRPGPRRRRGGEEFRQVLLLIVATLPAIAAGWYVNGHIEDLLRGIKIIAWATLGFGIVLYFADKLSMTVRRIDHLGFGGALFIGVFQVLSLIPGTSRSGITMTAGRILGLERSQAARFSMLMSIPVIVGAGTLKGWELYKAGDAALTQTAATAAGLSFAFALVTIALLMAWLRRASFTPFVLYRILLGGFLLWVAYLAPNFTFVSP